MSSSKMVNDRYRSALLVAKTAEVNADDIGARLEAVYPPPAKPKQPRPDWPAVIRLVGRTILARAEKMVAADRALIAELDDDREPRERREQARAALFERIGSLRGLIRGVYGAGAVQRVGLTGSTPTEPIALHRLAEHLHANLDVLASLAPVISGGSLDIPIIREDLAAEIASLGEAIDDLAQEARERETAQVAKDQAMAAHDTHFSAGARILEGLFDVAGAHELADRVRPSIRRPGQVDTPADDTPADDTPADVTLANVTLANVTPVDDTPAAGENDTSAEPAARTSA